MTSPVPISSRRRVPAERSGPAMRNLILTALELGLDEKGMRVVLVLLELTASWRRLEDRTTRGRIAELAEVSERTVTRTLGRLVEAGAIEWDGRPGRIGLRSLRLIEPTTTPPPIHAKKRDTWTARVSPQNETPSSPDSVGHFGTSTPRKRDTGTTETGHLGGARPSSTHVTHDAPLDPAARDRGRQQARRARELLRAGDVAALLADGLRDAPRNLDK